MYYDYLCQAENNNNPVKAQPYETSITDFDFHTVNGRKAVCPGSGKSKIED
jgi:hypothetical protein